MSSLLNEILQETESSPVGHRRNKCNCTQCVAERNQRMRETAFFFEIQVPASELASEFEMESITDKLLRCIRQINGISVLPSKKANEITLELQFDIQANKAAGDRFKDKIGSALRNCLAGSRFKRARVLIERDRAGGKISERVKKGMRFIDIRVLNGKKIVANIETKKGDSRYHLSQKEKDAQVKQKGRGPTYVVRNCPPGSTHPDCISSRGPRTLSPEITLLGEILNEFETPGRPLLKYGSKGFHVINLQQRLNYHNSSVIPLKEDGIWGPRTNAAVLFFQKMKMIKVDGIVGPITWGKLNEPASPPRYYPPVVCRLPMPRNVFEMETASKPSTKQSPLRRPQIRTCCLLSPPTAFTPNFADITNLGIHNGSNEVSGIVYTGKAGFIDLGHLRDICDLTKFVYDQMRTGAGYNTPILTTQGEAFLKICPADELKVAKTISYHDSLAHEVTTYTNLNPGGHNSSFSPEDLCSNNLGTIVAEKAINSILISPAGKTFNGEVTKILPDILRSLDAQTPAETQKAFNLVNGRWVDFTGATSLLSLRYLKRRNFSHIPWLAGHSSDSPIPSWLKDTPPLSHLYSYTNFAGRTIRDRDFPTEINTIRIDARSNYGNDFDKP